MKIISWNLLYRGGAAAADIAALIEQERPDIFLMQEATQSVENLPRHAGGAFFKQPWRGKEYSLAAWTKKESVTVRPLELPFSKLPGKFPPRLAQIIEVDGMSIANVHLSHGQLLNRRQLRTIADAISGPLAIMGDFNALGPLVMRGFSDVGPRRATHMAQQFVPFRLDRCLVRALRCVDARSLDRGPSDHRPIMTRLHHVRSSKHKRRGLVLQD